MKPLLLLLISSAALASAASPIGLLPQDKSPVTVEANERNPFGRKAGPVAAAETDTVTEETKIRTALEKMPVAGITESRTGFKVLLGSLAIEEGRTLSPVIPNQTEVLQAVRIENDKLELAFVEGDGQVGARRITILLNKAPEVRFRVGKPAKPAEDGEPVEFDGTLTKDEIAGKR